MINDMRAVKRKVLLDEQEVLKKPKKEAPIKKLFPELETKIYSYLNLSDLVSVSLVDKKRNKIVNAHTLSTPSLKEKCVTFSSRDWKRYCKKDVDTEGEVSSFPRDFYDKFNEPCPVFPGKLLGQTHTITWIPKSIGSEPLTLNSFGKVLKEHFPDNIKYNGYNFIYEPITEKHGETGPLKSYWALMTRNVIPGSTMKFYEEQQSLVANLSEKTPYEVPKIVEAVVCISTNYFKFKERLSAKEQVIFRRCQEQTFGNQLITRCAGADGLEIHTSPFLSQDYGVAVVRRSIS